MSVNHEDNLKSQGVIDKKFKLFTQQTLIKYFTHFKILNKNFYH